MRFSLRLRGGRCGASAVCERRLLQPELVHSSKGSSTCLHVPVNAVSPGRGSKLGSHGVKIDGVSLLITVFDMTELADPSPPDAAEGSVGAVKQDSDPRSMAARTKLRLLCYDPAHNSSGSLVRGGAWDGGGLCDTLG